MFRHDLSKYSFKNSEKLCFQNEIYYGGAWILWFLQKINFFINHNTSSSSSSETNKNVSLNGQEKGPQDVCFQRVSIASLCRLLEPQTPRAHLKTFSFWCLVLHCDIQKVRDLVQARLLKASRILLTDTGDNPDWNQMSHGFQVAAWEH